MRRVARSAVEGGGRVRRRSAQKRPRDQERREEPERDDGQGKIPFLGPSVPPHAGGARAVALEYVSGNQPDGQGGQRRKQDEIVQEAEHGNAVRDQVDGGEGVRHGEPGEQLRGRGVSPSFRERKIAGMTSLSFRTRSFRFIADSPER